MIEECVKIVNGIIKENNLNAEVISSELEDETLKITVEVACEDYNRVFSLENYFDNFQILWRQKTPVLVSAEIGDLVLIYDNYTAIDDDCDIGLVSSKNIDDKGEVYYGCRYINIALNNSMVNNLYDFEVTGEDYGGFKTGFLRVLSSEEAIDLLKKQLDKALEKEIYSAKIKHEFSVKNLPKLIDSFKCHWRHIKCDMIELDEESFPCSVDFKK